MPTLTVEIHGKTFDDLELALKEVTKNVSSEIIEIEGFDRNDSGRYYFEIKGEEELEPENGEEENDDDA